MGDLIGMATKNRTISRVGKLLVFVIIATMVLSSLGSLVERVDLSFNNEGNAQKAVDTTPSTPIEVFHGATRGNDIYVPGSFWFIRDAVSAASPGDRIHVNTNFTTNPYEENIIIDKTIELLGEGSNIVDINGNGGHIFTVFADWVNISGFNFFDADSAVKIVGADNVTVENCSFEDNNVGVELINRLINPIWEDDFSTDKGWDLGTYWQRGQATSSSGHSSGNPDPADDHSPTNTNY